MICANKPGPAMPFSIGNAGKSAITTERDTILLRLSKNTGQQLASNKALLAYALH
jgi:hypothetical protein